MNNTISFNVKNAINQITKPLKFHAYCIGTAKSGTHSIANMFSGSYRAKHEPVATDLMLLKDLQLRQEVTENKLKKYLIYRHKKLMLEMESSDLSGYFITEYLSTFPKAKFILTIREPYSFLESIINHQLNNRAVIPSLNK